MTRQTLSMILFHGWAGASSALNMDSTAPPSLVVSYTLLMGKSLAAGAKARCVASRGESLHCWRRDVTNTSADRRSAERVIIVDL